MQTKAIFRQCSEIAACSSNLSCNREAAFSTQYMICFEFVKNYGVFPFPVVFFEKIVTTVVLEYLSFLIVCYVRERNVCSGFLRIFFSGLLSSEVGRRIVAFIKWLLRKDCLVSCSATNERRSI